MLMVHEKSLSFFFTLRDKIFSRSQTGNFKKKSLFEIRIVSSTIFVAYVKLVSWA